MLKFLMLKMQQWFTYCEEENPPTPPPPTLNLWGVVYFEYSDFKMYQSEQIQLHASTRLQTCYNQATEDNQAEWNITLHGARVWSANTIPIKPHLCASLISVTQSIGMKNLKAKQLPSVSSSWAFLRLFWVRTTVTSVSKPF